MQLGMQELIGHYKVPIVSGMGAIVAYDSGGYVFALKPFINFFGNAPVIHQQ